MRSIGSRRACRSTPDSTEPQTPTGRCSMSSGGGSSSASNSTCRGTIMSLRMSPTRRLSAGLSAGIVALAALPCVAAAVDLQAIADRLEIQDVVGARYAMALDSSDAQAYASLFTEDA